MVTSLANQKKNNYLSGSKTVFTNDIQVNHQSKEIGVTLDQIVIDL